jgi:Zn-dependent peptidase ImmA (M78 family)
MISREKALRFARKHFPNGPESLAAHLNVEVIRSPLTGCDGWCLTASKGTIIRINENSKASRQRFTLAHELGHLVLEVPTVVGERVYESLKSDSEEERAVNDFAAEILLPADIVKQHVPTPPVVAAHLTKLARVGNVSELMAAIRIANVAEEVGLMNASVAFFEDGVFSWHWSKTLEMGPSTATKLLAKARESRPSPVRISRPDGKVIVASQIDNPFTNTTTLLVQFLPKEVGQQLSAHEQRMALEAYLFAGHDDFRRQLQGCFGAFKPTIEGTDLDEAVEAFFDRYRHRWSGVAQKRLMSPKGREYVRLRLSEWCRSDE